MINKVAIYGQYLHADTIAIYKQLINLLDQSGISFSVENQFKQLLQERGVVEQSHGFTSLDDSYDLLLSIGGDGTILRAVVYIGGLDIPVIGINSGRLGFLATVQKDSLEQAIERLVNGEYTLSKRSLLTATPMGHDDLNPNFALNEVTVSRYNTTSMIQIETHLNNELLTSYWADGLIISTPTGSTGYSLSCGGPVISPSTGALVLTPIAPHNLNARPLVIPDTTEIKIKVIGREESFLTSLDNRISSFPNETEVIVKKASFTIDLVSFKDQSFIKTIRHKLLWGEDKRN